MIAEVANPGKYAFQLKANGKNLISWWFGSCDVMAWRK
jgi:hypothetical protein